MTVNITVHGSTPSLGGEKPIIHLVKQPQDATLSFSPDPQDGWGHAKGASYTAPVFACGGHYRGCIDWVTAVPAKVTCERCKSRADR